jgi:hypothetical protein
MGQRGVRCSEVILDQAILGLLINEWVAAHAFEASRPGELRHKADLGRDSPSGGMHRGRIRKSGNRFSDRDHAQTGLVEASM